MVVMGCFGLSMVRVRIKMVSGMRMMRRRVQQQRVLKLGLVERILDLKDMVLGLK